MRKSSRPDLSLQAKTIHAWRFFCRRSPLRTTLLLLVVATFVSCIPLVPLFNLNSNFYWDWYNFLWVIEYFGENLRSHWSAPYTLNTNDIVGLVNPLFYGQKFYAAISLLSAISGSSIAVRICVFVLMVFQFVHIERAFHESTRDRLLSCTIGALLCWAIYPLTNLYNRSALTEFFAFGFLNISVSCLFVIACRSFRKRNSYYDAVAVGFFYVAAAVTHPLTALFGGIFIFILGFSILIAVRNRWLVLVGIVNSVAIGIILAPWLLLLSKFKRHFDIVEQSAKKTPTFITNGFFPNSIDNFWSKICPFPLDLRSLEKGIFASTPYLDAQIIVGYLLLAGLLIYLYFKGRSKKRLNMQLPFVMLCVALVLFALSFCISVNPDIAMFFGFFDILQFPYRLTNYINLSLLVVVFSLGELCGKIKTDLQTSQVKVIVVTACISVAFCSVILKMVHADTAREYRPPSTGKEPTVSDLPSYFYWLNDFSTASLYKSTLPESLQSAVSVRFSLNEGLHFGETGIESINLDKPSLVIFNVAAFPWNRLVLNGSAVSQENLSYVNANIGLVRGTLIATQLQAGNYTAKYQFTPDRIWVSLEFLSWLILSLWAALWGVLMFRSVQAAVFSCPKNILE